MLLCDLKENENAIISRLNLGGAFAQRLRDMGFCEGERVFCLKHAPSGSPVIYRVKSTDIALRKSAASFVEVVR